MERIAPYQKRKGNPGRPVMQYSLNGLPIKSYATVMEAAKAVGVTYAAISSCARGVTASSGGFMWRYIKK